MWSLSLHLILTIVLGVAGWQDWKTREVSNFITIPLLVFGLVTLLWHVFSSKNAEAITGFSLLATGVLTLAAFQDWMGGADWKVLVGLWNLWPLAGFAAMFGAGLWGMAEKMIQRNHGKTFPGVSVYAMITLLLLMLEITR